MLDLYFVIDFFNYVHAHKRCRRHFIDQMPQIPPFFKC